MFPSPTEVNHYECIILGLDKVAHIKFPSPTGVNHYELKKQIVLLLVFLFPSPTGVNHYELSESQQQW